MRIETTPTLDNAGSSEENVVSHTQSQCHRAGHKQWFHINNGTLNRKICGNLKTIPLYELLG